jgi:PTS system nitrogen regulatory IIA component
MVLEELITPDSVLCNASARSKKHCLEILSELLVRSTPEISNEEVFDKLVERERIGCTSLDQGVAFPHCRVEGLDTKVGALIKLTEPVEFDSPDGEPVDLVFGMMVPAEIDADLHSEIGRVADRLNDRALRAGLRDANTSAELYAALLQTDSELTVSLPTAARRS